MGPGPLPPRITTVTAHSTWKRFAFPESLPLARYCPSSSASFLKSLKDSGMLASHSSSTIAIGIGVSSPRNPVAITLSTPFCRCTSAIRRSRALRRSLHQRWSVAAVCIADSVARSRRSTPIWSARLLQVPALSNASGFSAMYARMESSLSVAPSAYRPSSCSASARVSEAACARSTAAFRSAAALAAPSAGAGFFFAAPLAFAAGSSNAPTGRRLAAAPAAAGPVSSSGGAAGGGADPVAAARPRLRPEPAAAAGAG